MAGKTLPQQIADQLRRDILRGRLEPGGAIKEREQALAKGVSRTPMREAIRILAKEGLVILRPARSPIVADPSLKEITDALEVLRALEFASSDYACERATDAEIAQIRAIHEKMARLYNEIDTIDRFELDMSFHLSIMRATHNPSLAETHRAYLARLWRVRYLTSIVTSSQERVLSQHGAIVDGLERRDADQVRRVIADHIDAILDNVRQRFEQEQRDRARARREQGAKGRRARAGSRVSADDAAKQDS